MNLNIKTAAALMLTALLLSGCGTAFEEESLPVPTVDRIKGESVSVSAQEAGASPYAENNAAQDGNTRTDEYESILTAPEVTETEHEEADDGYTADIPAEEKDEFDFKPEYDEEFFANDLFIGDSITTGFSGYGILAEENVYAKIGLNPLTALDTLIPVGEDRELVLAEELAEKAPARAYIMLGSNGIEWIPCSNMIESISGVMDAAMEASPDTQLIMLSIPPVTKKYDDDNTELEVMNKIREYNSLLSELCAEKGVGFIDITTMLEDDDGYFVHYYAETDGMHFKPTAYKMLLSKIEYTLS